MVALRIIEKVDSTIRHIHPVAVREADLSEDGRRDFGLCYPVCEDEAGDDPVTLEPFPVLPEVGDRL